MEQELKTTLNALTKKIKEADRTRIHTEEEVKQSFILPFLRALGYDVFDTNIIKPEYTADIGAKKGEKVDYAILRDGAPIVLIEAKHFNEKLDNHTNQLVRYFGVCASKYGCRFAILTNGIEYRFFTDTQNDNVMDKTPFLTINLEHLKERNLAELKRFTKDELNIEAIKSSAKESLYRQAIRNIFKAQVENPSDEFVEFFAKQITEKRMRQAVLDEFRAHIKKTLENMISDLASEQILAMQKLAEAKRENANDSSESSESSGESSDLDNAPSEEEMQVFFILKGIFAEREDIALDNIIYKNTINYFSINYANTKRWIARFALNGARKSFLLFGNEARIEIESLNDIFKHKNALNGALTQRLNA